MMKVAEFQRADLISPNWTIVILRVLKLNNEYNDKGASVSGTNMFAGNNGLVCIVEPP